MSRIDQMFLTCAFMWLAVAVVIVKRYRSSAERRALAVRFLHNRSALLAGLAFLVVDVTHVLVTRAGALALVPGLLIAVAVAALWDRLRPAPAAVR